MPRPKNALSIEDAGNPYNPLSAADVWEWHKQNAADAWKAAQDPQTWREAAQQYGQALLMGSIAPGGNSLGIRAFHGSPHSFDRFDLSKIGTGEGAQAYGHGLYFAQNEGVARSYRDALTRADPGPWNAQLSDLRERMTDLNHTIMTAPRGSDAAQRAWAELNLVSDQHAALLESPPQPAPGHMYEVGINADPEHFLHWDKPLSEQSQHVKNAVGVGPETEKAHLDMTGADLYRALEQQNRYSHPAYADGGLPPPDWQPTPGGEADTLRAAGIPGIKYLDQGSRDAGGGTHNYVVFNPETISILRKYGLAGLMGGGAAAAGSQQGDQ